MTEECKHEMVRYISRTVIECRQCGRTVKVSWADRSPRPGDMGRHG